MRLFYAALFVLISAVSAFAQGTDTTAPDTVHNDKISLFSAGISYGNTANYYGQTTAQKLPYVASSVSYQSKSGFYMSGSAIKLTGVGSALSELGFGVGYSKDITKRLGTEVAYQRSFFTKDSPLPQSVNPNTIRLGLAYDFKWLKSRLDGDYVFGNVKDEQGKNMNDFYLNLTNSKEIYLGSIKKDKDYFTLSPSLSFIAGTQVLSNAIQATEPETQQTANKKGTASIFDLSNVPEEIKRKVEEKVKGAKKFKSPNGEEQFIYSTSFDFLTSSINVPLAYNRNHYTVEAAYQLSIPNKRFEGIDQKNQSFFTLSFTYLFYKDK